jgi:hypothetical protein
MTPLSPITRQARCGATKPASGCRPRSSASKSSDLPPRAVGDHEGPGLGQGLQPRREVRRFADDAALLRGAFADQVTNHD